MPNASMWTTLRTGRVEINDRAVLLWIRWLFFLVLSASLVLLHVQ